MPEGPVIQLPAVVLAHVRIIMPDPDTKVDLRMISIVREPAVLPADALRGDPPAGGQLRVGRWGDRSRHWVRCARLSRYWMQASLRAWGADDGRAWGRP